MFICRVCLENNNDLISLKSESADCVPMQHMLSEFTIKNTEEQLSKYICKTCAKNLDIAYVFKRKYEDSTVKFIRSNQNETSSNGENNVDTICKSHSHQHNDQPKQPVQINICDVHQFYQTSVIHSNNPDVDLTEEHSVQWKDENPKSEMQISSVESLHSTSVDSNDSVVDLTKEENFPVKDENPFRMQISKVQTLHSTSVIDWNDPVGDFQEEDLKVHSSSYMPDVGDVIRFSSDSDVQNVHLKNEEDSGMRICSVHTLHPTTGTTSNYREQEEDIQEKEIFENLPVYDNQPYECQSQENEPLESGPQASKLNESQLQGKQSQKSHLQGTQSLEYKSHESKAQESQSQQSQLPEIQAQESQSNKSESHASQLSTIKQNSVSPKEEVRPKKRLTRLSARLKNTRVQDTKPNNPQEGASSDIVPLVSNFIESDHSKAGSMTDPSYSERAVRSNSKIVWSRVDDSDRTLTNQILAQIYTNHFRRYKPFRCDVCHRWFKTKGHIKTHRILHLDAEIEIRCGNCFLRFLTRSHYRKHQCS